MSLETINKKFIEQKAERRILAKGIQLQKEKIEKLKDRVENIEQARNIIQLVAKKTQAELEFHISDVVNLALSAVYDDMPCEFKAEFVVRRNKTELDLYLLRDGHKMNLLNEEGGGAVDIVSFALRVALWSLRTPHTRPLIIMDEPFKFLGNLRNRAGDMLKEVSKKLGIQIIMLSHDSDLIEIADRSFEVTQTKGVSKVKCLN